MTETMARPATDIRTFHIDVSDEAIADLKPRLAMTRWPDQETVDDRTQGVQLARLRAAFRSLADHHLKSERRSS